MMDVSEIIEGERSVSNVGKGDPPRLPEIFPPPGPAGCHDLKLKLGQKTAKAKSGNISHASSNLYPMHNINLYIYYGNTWKSGNTCYFVYNHMLIAFSGLYVWLMHSFIWPWPLSNTI
jgi:hypothetical protein